MSTPAPILRLAIPTPLRRLFDYLPPRDAAPESLQPGCRLKVSFGRQQVIAVLVELAVESDVPATKLKAASELLDKQPVIDTELLALLKWAAAYYHHPIGEVMHHALPALLREGRPPQVKGIPQWRLSAEGVAVEINSLKRAAKQQQIIALLQQQPDHSATELLFNQQLEQWRPSIKRLVEKGWLTQSEQPCLQQTHLLPGDQERDTPPELHQEQTDAVNAVSESLGQFQPFLLEGVTGSGKTEVYLSIIDNVIKQGKQALVLVPEIGLTPQLLERFQRRFTLPIAVLHSAMSDQERLCTWQMAREGQAPIIIGTRSALFIPLHAPGIIIIDEEHDASFKQQEGFRYSARDLALFRAQRLQIPIVLGSATPSLVSLYHVVQQRYQLLPLTQRAGGAKPPGLYLLDVRNKAMENGLSEPLQKAMQRHLEKGNQVLLFLNRRGYAPTMLCHECGWVSQCHRCDAHMTLYRQEGRLRCHHCGAERRVDRHCPACGSVDLRDIGQGTEKIEESLQQHFPDYGIVRIDRDSTRRKGSMNAILESIHQGEKQILIGTQMIAKGHHFPNVTLVGILDADQGLFSADFRASEKMAQQIIQVAGRAGREEKPGQVLIQTHHPEHPLLNHLISEGYPGFAQLALSEREEALMPPVSYMALLRAEAVDRPMPMQFLSQVYEAASSLAQETVELLGPIPSPMERRAGRYRAQLMLLSPSRPELHRLLDQLLPTLEGHPLGRKVRWSLDVDPAESY